MKRLGAVLLALALVFCVAPVTAQSADQLVAVIVFTIDDGATSLYQYIFPALNLYKFPATAYIITNVVGDSEHVTWPQIQTLNWTYGWEIGNHTMSHPHLTGLTYDQQVAEIYGAHEALREHGILGVQSFAPPFGEFDADTLNALLLTGHTSNRLAWDDTDQLNWPATFNEWNINVISYRNPLTFAKNIKPLITETVAGKKTLVIALHDSNPDGKGEYNLPLADLKAMLAYVNTLVGKKQIVVKTMSSATVDLMRYRSLP
jgi:peptidoglycan/xylan/chitin deacetylase (PgdA/CDA1 family)